MKTLYKYIKERLLINKNIDVVDNHYSKDTGDNEIRCAIIDLKNKYCDKDSYNAYSIGGTIVGAMWYLMYRHMDGLITTIDSVKCKNANYYLIDTVKLNEYDKDFANLDSLYLIGSRKKYKESLYNNARIILNYLIDYPELFEQKEKRFKLFC